MSIREFMQRHYRHFNAITCVDASEGWIELIENGGKMLVTLAGAMSTAELGISLAEMIRQGHVHAISCTAANLEEDIFHLVAHDYYKRIPHYRSLSLEDEKDLYNHHYNRVTDTCIPEEEAIRRIERHLIPLWKDADRQGKSYFPYEYIYQLISSGSLKQYYQIDPQDSWVVAACEKNLPIFTPGWEDCTTANIFAARCIEKEISTTHIIRDGIQLMQHLVEWYQKQADHGIGFFQIGGGIAGDFPICVVPLIHQDLKKPVPFWSYFCQISDSTTSFGSYSGATPSEKITWGKLDIDTPAFIIESDATIVAPLVFQYVLEGLSAARMECHEGSLSMSTGCCRH